MHLKDKKAIVTGGSQGIGKGIAIGLAQAGADISSFLGWPLVNQQGVLYVDGEMGANLLHERLTFLTTDKNQPRHPFVIANFQLLIDESGLLNLTKTENQKSV